MRKLSSEKVIVKIGTSTLSNKGDLNYKLIRSIARQITDLKKEGKKFIIVTSGAIGAGCREVGARKKPSDILLRQACAAIGQSKVMEAYHNAFAGYNVVVAQILLTYDDFKDGKKYANLRNGIGELLRLGAVPIINENDVVATDEIEETFGDNDKLSALVCAGIGADLLIMLSDVDGLYDKNPKKRKDAKLVETVTAITDEVEAMASEESSALSVGGMVTKIEAAKICMKAGSDMVIVNGDEKDVILRVIKGEEIGTLFFGKREITVDEL